MARLVENRYGKARVRVMKLDRTKPMHELYEWDVRVLLEGDFEETHTNGSNAKILPTDTMKNTVYSRARESKATTPEEFAVEFADFLLSYNPQVSSVELRIKSIMWKRIVVNGNTYGAAFERGSDEFATVLYKKTKEGEVSLECGIENLIVLKSDKSGFVGYIKDELTTLKETTDRLFATAITVDWTYSSPTHISNFFKRRTAVREALLRTFAEHNSLSVQQTLFAMAEAAINAVSEVESAHLVMPNKHCLLVDLSPFGQTNDNEVFVPTDEPHGYIEARVVRG